MLTKCHVSHETKWAIVNHVPYQQIQNEQTFFQRITTPQGDVQLFIGHYRQVKMVLCVLIKQVGLQSLEGIYSPAPLTRTACICTTLIRAQDSPFILSSLASNLYLFKYKKNCHYIAFIYLICPVLLPFCQPSIWIRSQGYEVFLTAKLVKTT